MKAQPSLRTEVLNSLHVIQWKTALTVEQEITQQREIAGRHRWAFGLASALLGHEYASLLILRPSFVLDTLGNLINEGKVESRVREGLPDNWREQPLLEYRLIVDHHAQKG